ncbi:uncharacterized protein [Dendropsophus ebraccatus]|uniref:uncharacterized protein n=1 Tax=Dendropsophus ebraccatus TaxID=150705 RepID=UPI0038319008
MKEICDDNSPPARSGHLLVGSSTGLLEIGRVDSPIVTLLGHNTTLPCLFFGYQTPLDLSMVSVRWTLRTSEGEEERVYWFHGGRHMQSRSGSHIPQHELERGDGSLYIPSIQPSDEGEYTCTVTVTPEKETSKVTMEVSAVPTCTVSDSRLEMHRDTERSVTCYVSGFYPETVKIYWMKYSKVSSKKAKLGNQTCTSIPVQNHDGTFDVRSVMSVRPMSREEDGEVYSCVITHRSLRDDALTCNVTISVQPIADRDHSIGQIIGIVSGILLLLLLVSMIIIYRIYFKRAPPEVWDIVGPELIHNKKSTLACPVVNFSPKKIYFSLYLNEVNDNNLVSSWSNTKTASVDEDLVSSWSNTKTQSVDENLVSSWSNTKTQSVDEDLPLLRPRLVLEPRITSSKNNVSSCICFIYITPDVYVHNGAKLILEVHHEALEAPKCKDVTLRVTAPPVLDPIEADQESYNVGDHVELSCRIHSFHPRYINVIWYKEEETLPSISSEAQKGEDGLFSTTSCVRVTVIEEDYGKIFRCKVDHQGTSDEEDDEGVTWTLHKKGD